MENLGHQWNLDINDSEYKSASQELNTEEILGIS